MPIYIVRWPNLSAALVRARDEDDLLEILDEVGDPSACRWQVYNGPLFINIESKARYDLKERPEGCAALREDITVGDIDCLLVEDRELAFDFGPSGETGSEMYERVAKFAFPHLAKAWEETAEMPDEEARPVIRRAVEEELSLLVTASEVSARMERKRDPVSRTAAELGTSPRLVERRWAEVRRREGN